MTMCVCVCMHALQCACARVSHLGEKLRDLLAKHGDFKSVEVELEKISTQTALNEVGGSWENDISLAAQGWTEQLFCILNHMLLPCTSKSSRMSSDTLRVMIANAHRWAASKGLVRTNPVHGLEEIKIPTKESFKFTNEQLQRSKLSGGFEAEDRIVTIGARSARC